MHSISVGARQWGNKPQQQAEALGANSCDGAVLMIDFGEQIPCDSAHKGCALEDCGVTRKCQKDRRMMSTLA
jgi:hypothetical protein